MKKRKTYKKLLLVCCLFLLGGCRRTEKTPEKTAEETIKELVMVYNTSTNAVVGKQPDDFFEVEEAVNEILEEKLGIHVKLVVLNDSYTQKLYSRIAANEKVDLMLVPNIQECYEEGYLLDLDDLLESDGKEITEVLGEEILEYGRIDGKQYGLGTNRDYEQAYGICMRKDIATACEIEWEEIKTIWDFEKVLKKVKEKYPDLFGIIPKSKTDTMAGCCKTTDPLGDGIGVLMEGGNNLEVVNYYETQEYEQWILLFRRWYQNGYIPKEMLSIDATAQSLMRDGKLFSYFAKIKPGFDVQESNLTGREMITIPLFDPVRTTKQNTGTQWGIYKGSDYPKEAMQLLNLLYTDADLMNLFCWGIEGKHYVVTEEGTIDFPEGVTAENSGYNLNFNWIFPNQYLAYVWKGDDLDLAQQTVEFNHSGVRSKAYGFSFDESNVALQKKRITEIIEKYRKGLENGVLNPKTALPRFQKELKEAGIDQIIQEKQRQLDEWKKSKN